MLSTMARALALLPLLPLAVSHMILLEPPTYMHADGSKPSLNPLDTATNTFPCQGLTQASSATTVNAGDNLRVMFGTTTEASETATHGGGTCQFSVSYDYPASANATWKNIYVVMGGCPTQNTENIQNHNQCGNSYDNPAAGCISQFDIPIPKQLHSGSASFAWTWFNAVGKCLSRLFIHRSFIG
jgi:hypothetical protein